MTTRQRLTDSGLNLNTALLIVGILGAVVTTVFFFAPLRTLPQDMQGVKSEVKYMQQTQAVQTEALKILADVAKDTRDTRREFDRHSAEANAKHYQLDRELEAVKKRLDRVENQRP
jgi:hypothetical protein